MPNIVIRHVSGTKANQVEEISLQGFREVLIGREANAHVRFDADREDLVSRNHARIVRDPADPNGFLLMDLDSRNGTFVNRQRIYGASRLQHGDRVQLGPSGPEFVFELDPPPAVRATRMADGVPAPPTREAAFGAAAGVGAAAAPATAVPPGMVGNTRPAGPDAPRPVGRATVERMLGEVTTQMKGESRRTMWAAVIGILVILAAGAGYFVWDRQQKAADQAKRDAEAQQAAARIDALTRAQGDAQSQMQKAADTIAKLKFSKAPADKQVVAQATVEYTQFQDKIREQSRELTDLRAKIASLGIGAAGAAAGGTGGGGGSGGSGSVLPVVTGGADLTAEQIHANNVKSVLLIEVTWKITDTENGGQIFLFHLQNDGAYCGPQGPAKTEYLPVFVEDGKKISPVLSTLPMDGHNVPIVSAHSGTGFLVGGEGFFLTADHVLAPWKAVAQTRDFTRADYGILFKAGNPVGCIARGQFPAWTPTEGSPLVIDQKDLDTYHVARHLQATAMHTAVQGEAVYFATFAKTMQRYRANMVALSERHDVALGKVDVPGGGKAVTMSPDDVHPGQPVVVMGYPAVSPDVYGVDVRRDMFSNRPHVAAIADPTLTTGPISKVNPPEEAVRGTDGAISAGEVYQLGINTTGAGNSGGPVFDSKGRVLGIFYAGSTRGGAAVTFAVPIKFGKQLIDNPSIIK